jgi:hypothetical protein|tara:strand:- start:5164 stop:6192 length:1029 start_codon:yes stop_codon:yes gene_type:complete
MESSYKDVRLYNPFLRPDWRFDRVLKLVGRVPTPGRTTKLDDDYIRQARAFMLRWRKGENAREQLLTENPGLYYAYMVYDNLHTDPEVRFMLEARLLAGQPADEIADALKTLPQTVSWYERLFFNIKPFLRHHDWIVKHVLLPSSDRFIEHGEDDDDDVPRPQGTPLIVRPHLDMTLKFFSYFGGPILCEFMIGGFRRGMTAHTQDDISAWLDDQWQLTLQRRSAQASGVFEVNRYNVMELFATHSRIIELQRGAESGDERRSMFERHVQAMLTELPWTVGREAKELYEGSAIGDFEDIPAELNAEELMCIGGGEDPKYLDELPAISITGRDDMEVNDAKAN